MSEKRERYLWVAGIMFIVSCVALAVDLHILHTVSIYWVGLFIGRFIESDKESEEREE